MTQQTNDFVASVLVLIDRKGSASKWTREEHEHTATGGNLFCHLQSVKAISFSSYCQFLILYGYL
jgi:hypothetical protein